MSYDSTMRIGIDITPLIQSKPTGVHLIAKYLTEAIIRECTSEQIRLIAFYPRGLTPNWDELVDVGKTNVETSFCTMPARLFHLGMPWWQRVGRPTVERIVGSLDVYHSFDWFTLHAGCKQTSTIYDLSTELFAKWHTDANRKTQHDRLVAAGTYADWLFFLSDSTQADWEAWWSAALPPGEVVYPGLSPVLEHIEEPTSMPELDGDPNHEGYLLYVSTLEPRKNLSRIVAAFAGLPKSIQSKHPLVLLGSTGWESSDLVERIDAEEHIIRYGYVSHDALPAWYCHARGLVYPSLYEGFGLPVIEALNFGCPVLTSKEGSLPEAAGDSAIYVDAYSTRSIREGMMQLITMKKEERKKLKKLGRNHASHFRYHSSAKAMIRRWHQLVA